MECRVYGQTQWLNVLCMRVVEGHLVSRKGERASSQRCKSMQFRTSRCAFWGFIAALGQRSPDHGYVEHVGSKIGHAGATGVQM